jgi:hypothetical protein
MNIADFKLEKNRQRPDFCYGYKKSDGNRKYEIFTMNGGKSFLVSIEEKRMDGRFYSEFSETFSTVDECLEALAKKEA